MATVGENTADGIKLACQLFWNGTWTERQANHRLDQDWQVRGSFGFDGYLGYDYRNQEWVEISRAA